MMRPVQGTNDDRALIIANGTLPPLKRVRALRSSYAMILCADGGANYARRLRIYPDVILGDLDSITIQTKKFFRHVPLLHMEDQESTDLEKAITFCIGRNIGQVDIVGATGSRLDHSIGSLGCFKRFGRKIDIRIIEGRVTITMIRKTTHLTMTSGTKLSLIPLTRCRGVTTKNLKYSLKNETLELGVRDGISNEATGEEVIISVKSGILLLYLFENV